MKLKDNLLEEILDYHLKTLDIEVDDIIDDLNNSDFMSAQNRMIYVSDKLSEILSEMMNHNYSHIIDNYIRDNCYSFNLLFAMEIASQRKAPSDYSTHMVLSSSDKMLIGKYEVLQVKQPEKFKLYATRLRVMIDMLRRNIFEVMN